MVNQSLKCFYTRFLLYIDEIIQDEVFLLDIESTFLNNLSPGVPKFLLEGGVQALTRIPDETINQGNQRLLFVNNAELEADKNIIMSK